MAYATWNEASEDVVQSIFQLVRKGAVVTLPSIRSQLDSFIDSLMKAQGGHDKAVYIFSNLAADAIECANQNGYTLTPAFVHRVLVRKQTDYGPENISRFGRQGLLVRLHDKVARLENLTSKGVVPENESIADTFMDIVGYCSIGIMWERGTFLLPLE